VQVLESGARALSAIHHQKPGLVLLDWRLPDLSSLALIRMIRADEQAARVPLVLVGGLNDGMGVEERLAGFDTGADLCLEEPIQPREFVARLRALLRRV
jgi:two-component system phosphate regulon response regulator PhoB